MFYQPATIEEALEQKRQHGKTAAFVAGGTDLIVGMNHGKLAPSILIDLSHVPGLDYLRREGDTWVAGPGCTFTRLAGEAPEALSLASLSIGGPQIRNRGTLGGNLASASPAADAATALLAFGATLTVRSIDKRREIPLESFFLDYRKTLLADDEMIESIRFADPRTSAWEKLGKRGAMNISLVSCAVAVSREGMYRVAFASVGPYPLRATRAEQILTEASGPPQESSIQEACEMASKEVKPISDFRGSAEYRAAMCGVLLRKCLREL